jgi:hypothetical protein
MAFTAKTLAMIIEYFMLTVVVVTERECYRSDSGAIEVSDEVGESRRRKTTF